MLSSIAQLTECDSRPLPASIEIGNKLWNLYQDVTSWQDADEIDVSPGDKIEFNRGAYNHVAIADGKGGAFHFSGEPSNKEGAHFRYDKIIEIAGEDKVRINNKEDKTMKPLPGWQIVERAKKQLGKGLGTYNLVINNCEHWACKMKYGMSKSEQVVDLAKTGVKMVINPRMAAYDLAERAARMMFRGVGPTTSQGKKKMKKKRLQHTHFSI